VSPAQQVAWVRDVPARCVCEWVWRVPRGAYPEPPKWVLGMVLPGCPWHGGTK
jgi:hypothetical protein